MLTTKFQKTIQRIRKNANAINTLALEHWDERDCLSLLPIEVVELKSPTQKRACIDFVVPPVEQVRKDCEEIRTITSEEVASLRQDKMDLLRETKEISARHKARLKRFSCNAEFEKINYAALGVEIREVSEGDEVKVAKAGTSSYRSVVEALREAELGSAPLSAESEATSASGSPVDETPRSIETTPLSMTPWSSSSVEDSPFSPTMPVTVRRTSLVPVQREVPTLTLMKNPRARLSWGQFSNHAALAEPQSPELQSAGTKPVIFS